MYMLEDKYVKEFRRYLGKQIRFYRKKLGYTQEELAEDTCMSYEFLSKIENGYSMPTTLLLVNICNALRITPTRILNRYIDYERLGLLTRLYRKVEGS